MPNNTIVDLVLLPVMIACTIIGSVADGTTPWVVTLCAFITGNLFQMVIHGCYWGRLRRYYSEFPKEAILHFEDQMKKYTK